MPTPRKTAPRQPTEVETRLKFTDQDARVPEDDRPRFVPELDEDGNPTGETATEIPFEGAYYRLNDDPNLFVVMEYQAAFDGEDLDGKLVATYHLIQNLLHEDSWPAFSAALRKAKKLDHTLLVGFINSANEALTARPTKAGETSSATA